MSFRIGGLRWLARLDQMRAVHAVVVGCGRVGAELALRLTEAGHTVSLLDKNRTAFARLPSGFTGRTVEGFGFDREHLEQAGIREASAFAAVTSGDNSNIVSARVAREVYDVPNAVARIYDPRRAEIYERLGVPTIATVTWTTDQVFRRLFPDETATDWVDPSGRLALVEHDLPQAWAGAPLGDLETNQRFRLVGLTRAGEPRLFNPATIGQAGDILHFLVLADAVDEVAGRLAIGPHGAS